jgi:hypothetical protein
MGRADRGIGQHRRHISWQEVISTAFSGRNGALASTSMRLPYVDLPAVVDDEDTVGDLFQGERPVQNGKEKAAVQFLYSKPPRWACGIDVAPPVHLRAVGRVVKLMEQKA